MPVSGSYEDALKEIEKAFEFVSADLEQMVLAFHAEMHRGLQGEASSLKMLPAHIDRASGAEKGRFIALDLGGTNFRVLQVFLNGKGKAIVEQVEKFVIPPDLTRGRGTELFDFIASSIQNFPGGSIDNRKNGIPLGFTFSFPVKQIAINKGELVAWTKGFSASGVVGKDVVRLLTEALSRNDLENIQVKALANDTVGTLLAGSYGDQDCDIGVIFGTGSNGCYRSLISEIAAMSAPEEIPSHMIVNTEWGNFDRLPVNIFDNQLDAASSNRGKQRMEKMISGKYLGELARLAIIDLIKRKFILGRYSAKFRKDTLFTTDISSIERDQTPGLAKVEKFLREKDILDSSVEERRCIRQICHHVSRRSAKISAAAISSVVTWMDPGLERPHTVAVDGTLYAKYPQFKRIVRQTLNEMHGKKSEMIRLAMANDGSGIGAAIAAAVAVAGVE